MEIGDALAQGAPGEGSLGLVLQWAKDFEVRGLGDGGFDTQDATGLVVHLDGIAVDPMFDADPFGALPEAAGELSGEVAMSFAAEEAQHVWAFEMRRGVLDQGGIDRGERLGVAEHQISGPFALIGRPVIALRPGLEDAPVQWIERSGDGVEAAFPAVLELTVHQALGQGGVAQAVKQLSWRRKSLWPAFWS